MPFPTNNVNLYGFRKILGDFSRPCLFFVNIPAIASGSEGARDLSCFARTAKLPDYKISTADIEFQGVKMKVGTVAEMGGSISLEFLLDEGHVLRRRILNWLSDIYDVQKNTFGSLLRYKVDDMTIQQLSRVGKPVVTYKFVGVFPTGCGEVSLSHGDASPAKMTVDFQYDYFSVGVDKVDDATGVSKSFIDSATPPPTETYFGKNNPINSGSYTKP
ncbi:MAG: hypothetical protein NZZ41_01110 [Candidatus Dojkabacteria bacterium]|nr:hypothetical protein [Candidatus Dojkabacteria bacterium]